MIRWLRKKLLAAPNRKVEPVTTHSPERCALWHDVSRALDAKPKSAVK